MKRIPLTRGQFTIVDDADFAWLNQWKWFAHWDSHTKGFYAVRNDKKENGKQYQIQMHRKILGLKRGNKLQADHINHNTLDNQRLNLRAVTCQENHFNQKDRRGYSWHKATKKYQASIRINQRDIYLGVFNTKEEAREAYLEAKKKYHIIREVVNAA